MQSAADQVLVAGVQFVEAMQLRIFQDLGVERRHAVGGVGEVDVHVGHVHPVVFVDDGKAGGAWKMRLHFSVIEKNIPILYRTKNR